MNEVRISAELSHDIRMLLYFAAEEELRASSTFVLSPYAHPLTQSKLDSKIGSMRFAAERIISLLDAFEELLEAEQKGGLKIVPRPEEN